MSAANVKAAQEAFEIQAKLAVGEITPEMFAEFAQRFPAYFAAKFDCSANDSVNLVGTDFMGAMKAFQPLWMGFLNTEVKNTRIESVGDSTVVIEQEYSHLLKDHAGAEIEGTKKTLKNTHTWNFGADGKVVKWTQTFDQAMVDSSRALEKAANQKVFEATMGTWGQGMKMWGEGALNSTNPEQRTNAGKIWNADICFDATFPMDYTDGLKRYSGIDEAMEYMKYLENWDMPDFNVYHTAMGPKGEVIACGSFTPTIKSTGKTGPKVDFIQKSIIRGGKFSEIKFYWGPTMADCDACFCAADLGVAAPRPVVEEPAHDADFAKTHAAWGACFAAWGAGKLTSVDECAKVCLPNAVFDARYPSKNNPALGRKGVFRGPAGCADWCTTLTGFDFSSFNVDHVCEGPDGTLLMFASDAASVKATGKSNERADACIKVSAKDGKVAMFRWFWGPGFATRDAAFVPDASRQWIVEHTFPSAAASEEWWAATMKLLSDPAAMAAWSGKQRELGFVNLHFMPEGGDKPIMCVWETSAEVTAEQFQAFIDGPDGVSQGGKLVNTCHRGMPGGLFPGSGFFPKPADDAAASTAGSFFWVHHEFQAGAADGFWAMMGGMGPGDMRAMGQKNNELGFHNHIFVPCGAAGPVFCVWECKQDLTVEQFQAFIDGPDGPGAGKVFVNACHKVAAGANVPSAKFPKADAAAVKAAPPSAAMPNTMAMAA